MRAGVALAAAVLATAADEGPLRNQTWVPLAPDAAIRRLALADEALASGNAATAFASLRALVLEARDPSGAPQWLPVDGKADGRVFADPSRILRDRVAALSGPARDAYLADAEIAAHAEAGSATTLAGALALAARFPGAPSATRALERSAQILSERGETWAARAAWSRLLASGAGADDARARWRRAAASEEPTSRPVSAPGRLKRRWTTLLPERPTRARPPVDRQAIDLGDAIAVQAPGELLLLDGATGRIRDRAPLPAGAKVDAAPLRRLARLSGDGSWIALAYAGTLALYERAPDGLRMRWTKSAPDSGWYADGPVVSGGRVVAAACAAQVETTVHVEAFDPATGERLFRRLLAKGGEPSPPDAPARALHPALVSPAPVVAAGPLAIVSTELGIVAGVDPLDGEIAWAVRTRRADAARTSIPVAPIALADRVVVAPADSDHVYVFRAAPASLRDPQTLFASPPIRLGERTFAGCFGADERRAYLVTQASGPSTSIEAVRLDDGSREVEDVPPEERGLGVPALLGGGIYLATDHGLVSFDARGELRAFAVAADGDGEFGDLSPVEDGVVSVSTASVSRHDVVP